MRYLGFQLITSAHRCSQPRQRWIKSIRRRLQRVGQMCWLIFCALLDCSVSLLSLRAPLSIVISFGFFSSFEGSLLFSFPFYWPYPKTGFEFCLSWKLLVTDRLHIKRGWKWNTWNILITRYGFICITSFKKHRFETCTSLTFIALFRCSICDPVLRNRTGMESEWMTEWKLTSPIYWNRHKDCQQVCQVIFICQFFQ